MLPILLERSRPHRPKNTAKPAGTEEYLDSEPPFGEASETESEHSAFPKGDAKSSDKENSEEP